MNVFSSSIKLFSMEQVRLVAACGLSPILGYLTPTSGFLTALVIMFGLNVWAGMRSDGVSIVNCRRFSFRKFKNALLELLLYIVIMEAVFIVMTFCGDQQAAVIAVKSLTYVFMYVYLQNFFRNLIIAYPDKLALRMIYHVIRLEFTRAMPEHIREIIQRIDKEKEEKDGKKD